MNSNDIRCSKFQINLRMDEKTQRYMQRIDRIMLTPRKAAPQARPSKSPLACGPRNLDKYIKYELSTKIIQNIINKNQTQLVNAFFNSIRNTEFRQKEKIYKFIGVEKNQRSGMKVDTVISGKILTTVLKDLVRTRYNFFINSLEEYSKAVKEQPSSNKPKLGRKKSPRESMEYGVLRRTSTIPERNNYRMVSQWIEDSSALEERQNNKKEEEEGMKKIATRIIVKTIETKIKKIVIGGFFTMQDVKINFNENEQNEKVQIPQIKETHQKKSMEKINYKILSVFKLESFNRKYIASIFSKLQKRQKKINLLRSNSAIALQIINKVQQKITFKAYHLVFCLIKLKKITNNDKQQPEVSPRSLKPSSIYKSQVSHMQGNPLIKLNFYSFVDKIFKLILVVSKMLLPMREAFIKIDQCACYAYRLEESLKLVPRRYLLHSFALIKSRAAHMNSSIKDSSNDPTANTRKLHEILVAFVKERLIDGFIHVKIMAKNRDLKIKILPAKDNIIEKTKKFINDRQEHKSHSYESLNELKNTLLSPTEKLLKRPKNIVI